MSELEQKVIEGTDLTIEEYGEVLIKLANQ